MGNSRLAFAVTVLLVATISLAIPASFSRVSLPDAPSNGGGSSSTTSIVHQVVKLTVSYYVARGAEAPSAPIFHYFEEGRLQNVSLLPNPRNATLSVDLESRWSVDPVPGTSPSERWTVSSQHESGIATEDRLIVFPYYHQFLLATSYSARPEGNVSTQPPLVLIQGGENTSSTLTSEPTFNWADENSTWSVDSILPVSSSERWWTGRGAGVVVGPATLNIIYLHQFLLTIQVVPAGSGSISVSNKTTSASWENASSLVRIQANPAVGFVFGNWTCLGSGCYPGLQNPSDISVKGPISLTVQFVPVVTVILQVEGSEVPQYVAVDNGTPTAAPLIFPWVLNSTHTLQALSNVSCGFNFSFFSGCTYEFSGWTVDGVAQSGNALTLTADKPRTITARWSKSYLNLGILVIGAAAAVSVVIIPLKRRKKHLKATPMEQLPSLAGPVGLAYRVGCLSDVGRIRSNNEDLVTTRELPTTAGSKLGSPILAAVADGVGGSQKGEVASKLTLTTLSTQVSRTPIDFGHMNLSGLLRSALESANDEVVKYGMAHRESEGLASTVVAAIIQGNTVHIANVGDSRAYLVNRGGIKQLSKDHSQVQELVDSGKLTSEQARHTAGRNVITRAVGASTDVQVDTYEVDLSPGDRILLCTDGLWEPVSDSEIQKFVMESKDPQAACEKLVALANERGGKDNVSVVIVEIRGPIEPDIP